MAPPRVDEPAATEPSAQGLVESGEPAGPALGQPAEAASAVAPLGVPALDPTAVNPAQPDGASPSGPPEAPPKLPPGRCSECQGKIERDGLEDVEREGEGGIKRKLKYHRRRASRHDLVGTLCGPVVVRYSYQVIATVRVLVPLPVEMDHPSALRNVEGLICSGLPPQSAVVTDWNLVGME